MQNNHKNLLSLNPSAILFDLDGTLADTAYDLVGAINYMRTKRNLKELDITYLRDYASQGSKGLLKASFNIEDNHTEFTNYQNEFLETYLNKICHQTVLFNKVIDILNFLE